MLRFDTSSKVIQAAILILIVASLAGPWMYDVIFVPVQYECGEPFVRLTHEFCGVPMSGMQFFEWFAGGFFSIIAVLVKGTFTGSFRELIAGLAILPLLPFFTTILLFWKKESSRIRTINLITWMLALVLTLIVFLVQIRDGSFRLWGLWLYILVAAGAVTFELLMRKNSSTTINSHKHGT